MAVKHELDPEMTAMLSWAAERVGLEWRPPRCPEPSRLDDWVLSALPKVHGELSRSWTAPFTARNLPASSSSLTTLDSGAARGYTGVPPVERSVAMQTVPPFQGL